MIPTRVLLQAAAAENHTPLIRFLGKRSPTSMFILHTPPPPLFSPSHPIMFPLHPTVTCFGVKKERSHNIKKTTSPRPFSKQCGLNLLPTYRSCRPNPARTSCLTHPLLARLICPIPFQSAKSRASWRSSFRLLHLFPLFFFININIKINIVIIICLICAILWRHRWPFRPVARECEAAPGTVF